MAVLLLRTVTCALVIAATATASAAAKTTVFDGTIASGTGPHAHLRGAVRAVLHAGGLTATPTTAEARFTLVLRGTLTGRVEGRAHGTRSNPDVGWLFKLSGSGVVTPLGTVTASGTTRALGFVKDGRFHLMLILHPHSTGRLVISATGPVEPGFSSPF